MIVYLVHEGDICVWKKDGDKPEQWFATACSVEAARLIRSALNKAGEQHGTVAETR